MKQHYIYYDYVTTTLNMMVLNPPTFIQHNNDFDVNGTILKCSSPRYQIGVLIKIKKKTLNFPRKDMGIR
jgi:hypothetical protein